MSTIRAIVTGHVQGVNYRRFAVQEAQRLGVAGYVRNLESGGEVEVVATATDNALESYVARLRQGPPAAIVHGVAVEHVAPEKSFSSFGIRY